MILQEDGNLRNPRLTTARHCLRYGAPKINELLDRVNDATMFVVLNICRRNMCVHGGHSDSGYQCVHESRSNYIRAYGNCRTGRFFVAAMPMSV